MKLAGKVLAIAAGQRRVMMRAADMSATKAHARAVV
jgi:hypothetical protein